MTHRARTALHSLHGNEGSCARDAVCTRLAVICSTNTDFRAPCGPWSSSGPVLSPVCPVCQPGFPLAPLTLLSFHSPFCASPHFPLRVPLSFSPPLSHPTAPYMYHSFLFSLLVAVFSISTSFSSLRQGLEVWMMIGADVASYSTDDFENGEKIIMSHACVCVHMHKFLSLSLLSTTECPIQ